MQEIEDKLDDLLEAWGIILEGNVKKQVPVDTGRLRNSIAHATKKDEGKSFNYHDEQGKGYTDRYGSGLEGKTVAVGTNVEYARDVELNDRRVHVTGKAHYLRDGVLSSKSELEEAARKIKI